VYTELTQQAICGNDKPGVILQQVKSHVPSEYASAMPCDDATKRRIRMQRQKSRKMDLSPPPNKLTDLGEIPETLVTIEWNGVEESVIKGDSGQGVCSALCVLYSMSTFTGPNRVLLLATNYILAQTDTIEEIFEDGTFRSCAKQFYQVLQGAHLTTSVLAVFYTWPRTRNTACDLRS
jgi:hypothetical protein